MIVMSHPQDGWNGTWGLTVAFLAKDILSDGEPFEAVVYVEDGHGDDQTFHTRVTAVEGASLVLANGQAVDVDYIVRLEVP